MSASARPLVASPSSARSPWLVRVPTRVEPRLRLFAFPYAGGGASIFHSWRSELAPEVELIAVQPPGRETRMVESPFTAIGPLVAAAADALAPHLDLPFAFVGHSMGALLAFDLTRELRRRGRPGPAHLFVSGRRAPHLISHKPPLHSLPPSEFLAALRRLDGTDAGVLENAELMEILLPILRADMTLCETRVHGEGEPLACAITAFGGVEDSEAGFADIAAWRHHTRAAFRMRTFPGGHFFLRSSRTELLKEIARDLKVTAL